MAPCGSPGTASGVSPPTPTGHAQWCVPPSSRGWTSSTPPTPKIGRASCRERVENTERASRRRHTSSKRDWSSDVCSSDLMGIDAAGTLDIKDLGTVTRLGYGAMRITGDGIWGEPADPDGARAVVRSAVEQGVDFIDTADS